MTDHARFRALLEAQPEFDLEPGEQAELDAHLESCDACRAYGADLAGAMRAVADLPPIDAPARVRRRLGLDPGAGDATPRRRPPRWALGLAGVVAAAAPLTIAVLLLGGVRLNLGPFAIGGGPGATPAPAALTWSAAEIGRSPEGTGEPGSTGAPLFEPEISALRDVAIGKSVALAVGEACPDPAGDAGCAAAVVISDDAGSTWSRVIGQSSLAVAPVPGGVAGGMRSIVETPGGFVAVGVTGGADGPSAVVWASPDGRRWQRVDDPSFAGAWMNAIAAVEGRLVTVGGRVEGGRVVGASWVSADGETWIEGAGGDRLEAGAAVGSPDAGYSDVVAFSGPAWVAIGRACSDRASCRGIVRTSPDGLRWIEAGGRDPFAGGIAAALGWGGQLVAVGRQGDRASAWLSGDGSTWMASTIDVEDPPLSLSAVDGGTGRWLSAGIGPDGSVVLLEADQASGDDVPWGRTTGPDGRPGGVVLAVAASAGEALAVLVGVDDAGRGFLYVGVAEGSGQ